MKRGGSLKKAQAALEHLMTHGWEILVILIAIGILIAYGVLRPEKNLPEKCFLPSTSGFVCESHAVREGSIALIIRNVLDQEVFISSARVDFTGKTCSKTLQLTIGKESMQTIILDNDGAGCDIAKRGNMKGELIITYKRGNGLVKVSSGQLISRAE